MALLGLAPVAVAGIVGAVAGELVGKPIARAVRQQVRRENPLLAVIGNPPRSFVRRSNGDVELRVLEREAELGDARAMRRLASEWRRRGIRGASRAPFFFQHAGHVRGRRVAGALELAQAERRAKKLGWEITAHQYYAATPTGYEWCIGLRQPGMSPFPLESVCGYEREPSRRLVRVEGAQLALEHQNKLGIRQHGARYSNPQDEEIRAFQREYRETRDPVVRDRLWRAMERAGYWPPGFKRHPRTGDVIAPSGTVFVDGKGQEFFGGRAEAWELFRGDVKFMRGDVELRYRSKLSRKADRRKLADDRAYFEGRPSRRPLGSRAERKKIARDWQDPLPMRSRWERANPQDEEVRVLERRYRATRDPAVRDKLWRVMERVGMWPPGAQSAETATRRDGSVFFRGYTYWPQDRAEAWEAFRDDVRQRAITRPVRAYSARQSRKLRALDDGKHDALHFLKWQGLRGRGPLVQKPHGKRVGPLAGLAPPAAPRRNPPVSAELRLPRRLYRGTITLAEARARRVPGLDQAIKGFSRFHGGLRSDDEVVLIDDGRSDDEAAFLIGETPEITYDNVPEGSDKEGSPWGHKTNVAESTGRKLGRPTYLAVAPRTGMLHMFGGVKASDWLRG